MPPRGTKWSDEHRATMKAICDKRPPVTSKICGRCEELKPKEDFKVRSNGSTLKSYCITCERAYNSEKSRRFWHRQTPKEKKIAIARNREYCLKAKYGLTKEQYNSKLADQDGVCAICGADEPGGGKHYLVVDHDHNTNEVRGLLCVRCNNALGLFRDNVDILNNAAAYLLWHLTSKEER